MCVWQRAIGSFLTTQVLGAELRLAGLETGPFTCWAMLARPRPLKCWDYCVVYAVLGNKCKRQAFYQLKYIPSIKKYFNWWKLKCKLGIVAQLTFNLSTPEAQAGGLLQVLDQSELNDEITSQKTVITAMKTTEFWLQDLLSAVR